MTAYHAGELADEKAAKLQAHLKVCSLCAQALAGLPSFYQEAEAPVLLASTDAGLPSAAETDASWQSVRARLAAMERRRRPPGGTVFFPVALERRRWPRFSTAPAAVLGMALSLLGCLIGFPTWMLTHPAAVPSVVLYLPLGEVTRGSGNEKELDIGLPGRHGGSLTVVCPLPDRASSTCRVEIEPLHGGGPQVSAQSSPQAGAASGEPSVTFPAEQLAPGDYRLVVSPDRGEPIGEWLLHIRAGR